MSHTHTPQLLHQLSRVVHGRDNVLTAPDGSQLIRVAKQVLCTSFGLSFNSTALTSVR